jgi:hypothetical protein
MLAAEERGKTTHMDFTRRTFVTGAAALAVLAPTATLASATVWAFPAFSGRRLFGLLTSTDPTRHEAELEAMRQQTGYFRPLAYASTDRNKTAFATAVIAYRQTEGMGFTTWNDAGRSRPAGVIAAEPGRFPNLEQMARFLTGCAYGAEAGASHPLKRTLIDRYTVSV